MKTIEGLVKGKIELVEIKNPKSTGKYVYDKNIINFKDGLINDTNQTVEDLQGSISELKVNITDKIYSIAYNYWDIALESWIAEKELTGKVIDGFFIPRCPHCKILHLPETNLED